MKSKNNFKFTIHPKKLDEPLKVKKSKIVFVCSMSDLFYEESPDEFIDQVFETIRKCPQHLFLVLTKRAERMAAYFKNRLCPDNVFLGVTVENRAHGLPRLAILQGINARNRFLSIEPLLEDLGDFSLSGIHWVIVGGESGSKKVRPMNSEWVRRIRDLCLEAKVPFFFKQWGSYGSDGTYKRSVKHHGHLLDGQKWMQFPKITHPAITKAEDQNKVSVADHSEDFLRLRCESPSVLEKKEPVAANPPNRFPGNFHVAARTRDSNNENHGLLLRFEDVDGHPHELVVGKEKLVGDGGPVIRTLLSHGLDISGNQSTQDALVEHLMECNPPRVLETVGHPGWHGDSFVLGTQVFGKGREGIISTPEAALLHDHHVSGSLTDWKSQVGQYCRGNSRLILAGSMPLAAPILHCLRKESGGIHLVGPSSIGKTTALRVALSVMGSPEVLMQNWWSTVNGLAATARHHNDLLLVLDEIAQVTPRAASDAAYMLGNGQGKQRATSTGGHRPSEHWRLLFLSSGEVGLVDHLAGNGITSRAGQQVRFLDLPADPGKEMGIFEETHELGDPVIFAEVLNRNARKFYGAPFHAFLARLAEWITPERETEMLDKLTRIRQRFTEGETDGQILRAAERFALIGLAGELATDWDLTGWEQGEAIAAAERCFADWLNFRGGEAAQEARQVIDQLREFLDQNEETGFRVIGAPDAGELSGDGSDLLGCKQDHQGQIRYYLLPDIFQDKICGSIDSRRATRYLVNAGLLIKSTDRKNQVQKRWSDGENRRSYCVIHPAAR